MVDDFDRNFDQHVFTINSGGGCDLIRGGSPVCRFGWGCRASERWLVVSVYCHTVNVRHVESKSDLRQFSLRKTLPNQICRSER